MKTMKLGKKNISTTTRGRRSEEGSEFLLENGDKINPGGYWSEKFDCKEIFFP